MSNIYYVYSTGKDVKVLECKKFIHSFILSFIHSYDDLTKSVYARFLQVWTSIYFVTHWVILLSVNSKSIHQLKQKPTIWSDILLLKIQTFRIAVLGYITYVIHLSTLTSFFCTLLMNKSLCCVKLSLELHVVSTFWLGFNI